MEFILEIKDACVYFQCFLSLIVFWIVYKYGFSKRKAYQKVPEPEPVKSRLRLLRLPLVAFKECILSMDLDDIIHLSLCSKYTANTIKLFRKSYFKEITNCKIKFTEDYGCLAFSTSLKTHYYSLTSQKFAEQFLELSACREVEVTLNRWPVIEEFVSWGYNYEDSIESVYCLEYIDKKTTIDLVKKFEDWKRLILIHGCAEFHINQTNEKRSISIISCDHDILDSFWKLPHHYIHFSEKNFKILWFIDYLQRWIGSSIPCTELIDFSAKLYPPDNFVSILSYVEFEEIDEEWIHPVHGTILPPSYKIQRSDRRKNALLFRFQKDGEPCLGMHIY